MTVKCVVCGTLSRERNQPLKFLCLRAYLGAAGIFWYFCSFKCLRKWVEGYPFDYSNLQDILATI